MPEFDWEFPYPSQRMPVLARNVVATSQPLAAQAGLEMMAQGGNAIDAAIAAAITLTVVEPTSNGIGADAFALIWAGGGLHGLNASGRSPAALDPAKFEGMDSMPLLGWDPVTVPGAVSGWAAASGRFGALPFEKLFEPAIRYARDGFMVTPYTAYYWKRGEERYAEFPSWAQTFTVNGKAPSVGELFRSEAHARTLQEIAETRGESLYRGALAKQIAAFAKAGDGALSESDLEAHEPQWVRPIAIEYSAHTLHEIPPNGQGLTALIALGILRHINLKNFEPDSAESLHVQIESMKLAFRDAHQFIADPAHMDVAVDDLLSEAYLASRYKLIDLKRAQDFKHGMPKPGGTVYLTTADAQGNMASFIQSNYAGFGSGLVVPDTGIALQNRGACFVTQKGHANCIGPSKLPYHTIIPGFVTQRDEPLMSYGVMGGYMQPQGHAQVLVRIADYKQNPQAALDAPRWQISDGLNVQIEPGFAPQVYEKLQAMGHHVTMANERGAAFGRGQIAYRTDHGYFAASDLRSDGQAVGF